ncbi:hypothetical protein [Ramlibacter sp. 2FC]|uniref:hypothetical protein n=1 Tax=Ramlibacter sp. 2FC TaxID=2502188 RepID=UPI0010F52AFF|nr:hypothetical protein [Ramlibacter sp. 2FC]
MSPQEIIVFKLQPALEECAMHRQRLHQAWLEASGFAALKEDAAAAPLGDDQVRTLDQLVFRFGRLQDAMGTRLLPALLQLTQEWRDDEPFLDKLNRAEKLGMLPSAEQWQLLREMRNQTAHEYPSQPELVRANLRRLVAQVPVLELAHAQLAAAAQQRTMAHRS